MELSTQFRLKVPLNSNQPNNAANYVEGSGTDNQTSLEIVHPWKVHSHMEKQ